jgi:hypothetical protein
MASESDDWDELLASMPDAGTLAADAYADVAAEMRGIARCARAYFRTLLAGPFDRDEAFILARDWHRIYWSEHAAPRGDEPAPSVQ